jgi:hypothetical protein
MAAKDVASIPSHVVKEFWDWHFWDYHQEPREVIDRALLQFDAFCRACDKMNREHEQRQLAALPIQDTSFEGPRLQKMSREKAKTRKTLEKRRQRAQNLARKRQSRGTV